MNLQCFFEYEEMLVASAGLLRKTHFGDDLPLIFFNICDFSIHKSKSLFALALDISHLLRGYFSVNLLFE